MSNPVVGKLILKELSLNRFFMAGAVGAGLLSIVIACFGKVAFAVGGICFLTVLIAYGVTLPMFAIAGERKEKSQLFMLSLPVSRGEYVWAKVIGVFLSFLVPWSVLLLGVVLYVFATPVPDGLFVLAALMMGFALADFCVIVCTSMLIDREGLMALIIIFMNMSVTFFMVCITSLTRIGPDAAIDAVNWSTPALVFLGSEAAVVAGALAILFWVTGREPEVV